MAAFGTKKYKGDHRVKITCWNCEETFNGRGDTRQRCPRCGSRWWQKPSLFDRLAVALSAGRKAYQIKPRGKRLEEVKVTRVEYLSLNKLMEGKNGEFE